MKMNRIGEIGIDMKQKDKLYKNIWCCAYQRAFMYRETPRGERERETVQMCLGIAKWEKFEEEKKYFLTT